MIAFSQVVLLLKCVVVIDYRGVVLLGLLQSCRGRRTQKILLLGVQIVEFNYEILKIPQMKAQMPV